MKLRYKMFRKKALKSWESTFDEVCAFATEIGQAKVVNVSQSSDAADSVVIVWYWD